MCAHKDSRFLTIYSGNWIDDDDDRACVVKNNEHRFGGGGGGGARWSTCVVPYLYGGFFFFFGIFWRLIKICDRSVVRREWKNKKTVRPSADHDDDDDHHSVLSQSVFGERTSRLSLACIRFFFLPPSFLLLTLRKWGVSDPYNTRALFDHCIAATSRARAHKTNTRINIIYIMLLLRSTSAERMRRTNGPGRHSTTTLELQIRTARSKQLYRSGRGRTEG